MSDEPKKPKASSLSISTATLDDFMPRDRLLELGLDGCPFTVAGREDSHGDVVTPSLIIVGQNGVLHHFTADEESEGSWVDEQHPVPHIKGMRVTHIDAARFDSVDGEDRLLVMIGAVSTTQNDGHFVALQRLRGHWSQIALPPGLDFGLLRRGVTDLGVTGLRGGKLQTFYTCLDAQFASRSLLAVAIGSQGESYAIDIRAGRTPLNSRDKLVGLANHNFAVLRQEDNGLRVMVGSVHDDANRGVIPAWLDGAEYFIEVDDGPVPDVTYMTPIQDSREVCTGVILRDADGRAYYVGIGDDGRPQGVQRLDAVEHVDSLAVQQCGEDIRFIATGRDDLISIANWRPGSDVAPEWVATGERGRKLTAARIGAPHAVMLVEGLDGGIDQIAQTEQGDWVRTRIEIADQLPEPEKAHVHALQISTTTVQSDPVAHQLVRLTSDHPAVAEFEGRLIRLGPNHPVELLSNDIGALQLKVRARGLEAPIITASLVESEAPAARYRPQEGALRRLAGLDPQFEHNGRAMQNAGIIPSDLDETQANQLAETIKAAALNAYREGMDESMQFQRRRLLASVATSSSSIGVRIERGPDGLSVRDASGEPPLLVSSGLWNSFKHFVKKAWHEIEAFTVRVVEDVVEVVVEAAGKVTQFLADTARRIGEGLQTMLSWLNDLGQDVIDAAKKVVDWVVEKLGWGDVIRAKDGVKHYTLQTFHEIEDLVGRAIPAKVTEGVTWAKNNISQIFDNAILKLGGGHGDHGERVSASPVRSQLQTHGAKALSVHHAVPTKEVDRPLFTISDAARTKLTRLNAEAERFGQGEQVQTILHDLSAFFNGKVSIEDAMSLMLGDILGTLKPLVILALDVVDTIQTLIFELVAEAIRCLRLLFEMPITQLGSGFNWINSTYKQVSGGSDLSLIDLSSLLFVTPGVILHHIIVGRDLTSTNVPERYETHLAGLPRLLDHVSDENGLQAADDRDPSTPISDFARAAYGFVRPIYRFCSAVWTYLRAAISPIEDGLRLADAMGASASGTLRTVFSTLVKIADYGLLLWAATEAFFEYVGAKFEEWYGAQNYTILLTVMVYIAFLALVCVLGLLKELQAMSKLLAPVLVWAVPIVLLVVSIVIFIITFVRWVMMEPEREAPNHAYERFHIDRTADMFGALRKSIQLGVPIGAVLLSKGPHAGVVGLALIALNTGGNQLLYGGGGLLMGASAVLAVT